jgi:sulfatase maturation enzyme AslB (radical SAM superfamily)
MAIDAGRTDIDIRMNTNATNLNKEYRELLSKFTNLTIVCSVDGYNQINKYIRWPADWDSIVSNVHGLLEITPNVAFNVTVGIWNISNLSQLVFFFEKEFPNCSVLLNQIMWPPHQMPTAFPNKELAISDLESIRAKSMHYQTDQSFKSKVDFYVTELQQSTSDLRVLTEFFKFNDKLDQSRNVKLADYIPELEKCRDYLK